MLKIDFKCSFALAETFALTSTCLLSVKNIELKSMMPRKDRFDSYTFRSFDLWFGSIKGKCMKVNLNLSVSKKATKQC